MGRAWHRRLCVSCEEPECLDSELSGGAARLPAMSSRTRNIIVGVVAAVLLVTVVGPFVYINFIKDDPPERLSLDDVTTTTTDSDGTTSTTGAAADGHRGRVDGGRRQHRRLPDRRDAVRPGLRGRRSVGGRHGRRHDRGHVGHRGLLRGGHEPPSRAASRGATASSRTASWRSAEFPTATFVLTSPIELGGRAGRRGGGHGHRHRRPHAPRRHPRGHDRPGRPAGRQHLRGRRQRRP